MGEFIDANGFDDDVLAGEVADAVVKIRNGEGEVAETLRFRIGRAFGRVGKGEEFDLGAVGQCEVQFPGLAFFAKRLADHWQPQDFGVELFGSRVVRTDNGDVVNSAQNHACKLDMFHGNGNRPSDNSARNILNPSMVEAEPKIMLRAGLATF